MKSKEATMEEMRVPAVYLKMTDNITWKKMTESFSEGTFRLLLTQLDSIYTIELVACEI